MVHGPFAILYHDSATQSNEFYFCLFCISLPFAIAREAVADRHLCHLRLCTASSIFLHVFFFSCVVSVRYVGTLRSWKTSTYLEYTIVSSDVTFYRACWERFIPMDFILNTFWYEFEKQKQEVKFRAAWIGLGFIQRFKVCNNCNKP